MSHQQSYPGAPAVPGQYGQPPPGQFSGYTGVPGYGIPAVPQPSPYGAPQPSPYGTPATTQSPYGTPATTQSHYGTPATTQSPYGTPATTQSPYGAPATTQPSPYGAPSAPHPTPYGALPTHPGAAGQPMGYGAAPTAGSFMAPAPSTDPLWATFSQVAGPDQKIDAVELCKCLTLSGFTGSYKPFTQETCKIMIALLDRDKSGKMEFSEFKELWSVLLQWKQTFEKLDKDKSGSLDEQELKSAIASFGYSLSATSLNAIMKRYNTNGLIYFDDFIALTTRIRSLSSYFISRDTARQGRASLTYDDFMTHAMAC